MNLQQVVATASADPEFPPIKLIANGTIYIGYAGTAEQERERFEHGLAEGLFNAVNPKNKKQAEAAYQPAVERARALAQSVMASGPVETQTGSFVLLNCQIWPAGGGDGVEVPAVHIPYAAVDGWWIGAEKRLSAKNGGGGLFAGVLFPIPTPG